MSTKHPVVAVIDDDLSVLDAMASLLSTHGFDVELYVSPSKFLEAVMTTQAICLIVDVQLGESCGVEFVRQLSNRGLTFPVIFITGSDDKEIEQGAIETGCVTFFRKPFSAYLLIETLNHLPDSHSSRRPRIFDDTLAIVPSPSLDIRDLSIRAYPVTRHVRYIARMEPAPEI